MKIGAQRAALLLFAGMAFVALPGRAQKPDAPAISPTKQALIQRVLVLTGSANLGQQMSDTIMASMQESSPEVSQEFWEGFKREFDMGELIQKIVPIYDRHFSEEDLKGLVDFYESPVGRKVTAELPGIMRESMAVGQEWGMAVAERIMERLEKEKERKKEGDEP